MNNKQEESLDAWFYFLIAFMGIPLLPETNDQYIVIFIVAIILIWHDSLYIIKLRNSIEKLMLWFVFFWLYGIGIGFLHHNGINDIIQNFAGMSVYLFGIVLVNSKHVRLQSVFKALYYASIIVCLEVITVFALRTRGIVPLWPLSNIRYNIWTSSIYTWIAVIIFVSEAISLWRLLHKSSGKERLANASVFVLSTVAILTTMDSAGYLFGYLVILSVILFLSLKTNKKSARYWIVSIVFLIIIVILALYYESKTGVIGNIFSSSESGNGKRYYQFQLIMERFKFFGNGLGSHLRYSYGINSYDTYGIEVSYLNLIDKFGVFGLVLICFFFFTFLKPIQLLVMGKGFSDYNVIAIGLQGYLFVALGNPVLFAPYCVLAHIFAMLFISDGMLSEEQRASRDLQFADL